MRKHLVLWVAALLLATTAQAADRTGKIVSVDPAANTFTIQTDDGDRVVYRTAPTTRVMREGASIELGDMKVGTRVEVTAPDVQDPALRIANEIKVVDVDVAADVDRDDRMARAERLPRTAGPVPLIGLVGAGLVVAGLISRRFQR